MQVVNLATLPALQLVHLLLVHLTASDGSECRMAVDNLVLICTRSLTARRHVHPACGQQCGAQLSSVLVLFSASGVSCLGVGRAVRIRHRARLRVLGVLSGVLGGVLGGCARPWHGGPCQSERRCARRYTHVSTCTQAGPGRDHKAVGRVPLRVGPSAVADDVYLCR